MKTRKVERLAEGVASFDLSSNGERMPVELKRAEPGGEGGRGDARAMAAGAGRNAAQGWRRHHGPGGRGSARRSARGVEADLPRSVAYRGSYFYDANLHGFDAVAMEKKYDPYVETLASRDDLNHIYPGNTGRPDGESSARRWRHRPLEPAPRRQAKKLQSRLPRKSRQPGKPYGICSSPLRVLTLKSNYHPAGKT